MVFVILCILFTTTLFLIFKGFEIYKINTLQAIVVNYWICVLTGGIFLTINTNLNTLTWNWQWGKFAIILGIAFIGTFYLMALSSQKISVSMTTLASKMSLIIPVFINLFFWKTQTYTILNYIGLVLALMAIVFSSIPKNREISSQKPIYFLLIPAIFLLSGSIDSLLNYANNLLITDTEIRTFPTIVFGIAATLGSITVLFQKEQIKIKNIIGGIVLGIPNYFSIYFLLKGLQYYNNNGALIYPINNISIIILSSFSALFLFKEHLSILNKMGIFLAITAIILISS